MSWSLRKKKENEKSDGSCERTLLSYRDHIYVGTYEHAVRGVMTNPFGSVASDVWILRFFFLSSVRLLITPCCYYLQQVPFETNNTKKTVF